MSKEKKTKESQYERLIRYKEKFGIETLGLMTNQAWIDDPKRLTFTFSRYKFVSKILNGLNDVIEIGCADAFASRIVKQSVNNLTVTDFDEIFIDDVNSRLNTKWPIKAIVHDILKGPYKEKFDGAYALDVLEHINPSEENIFISNICSSLKDHGVLVIGIPSIESQAYASDISKEGHVNCKSMPELNSFLNHYFHNIFMFSMNDEVVHTGFHKMANYIFAVCCSKKI